MNQTSDWLAIIELVHRYAWVLDDREWTRWADVFAADAEMEFPGSGGRVVGGERISRKLSLMLDALDTTQHLLTNLVITFSSDTTATARVQYHAQHVRHDCSPSLFVVAGHYSMGFVVAGPSWRIQQLVPTVTWTQGNDEVIGGITRSLSEADVR